MFKKAWELKKQFKNKLKQIIIINLKISMFKIISEKK